MLPQKKNSDVAELARGKSGRLVGNLTGLLVTLKGLPLTYNRDLQEDKEPLFDSVRQAGLVLAAMDGAYRSMTFNVDVAARAADDQLLVAIDVAERLVTGGMPFRQAHEVAGSLVGRAIREGRTLREVASEESAIGDVGDLFVPGAALANRRSPGGAGPSAAGAQRDRLRRLLASLGDRL